MNKSLNNRAYEDLDLSHFQKLNPDLGGGGSLKNYQYIPLLHT